MTRVRWYLLFVLVGAVFLIWRTIFALDGKSGILSLTVFDVGQGDAIFIETPSGGQILVDGGPGETVLSRLSEAMPFWDRTIDAVVLTHPHADHVSGLVAVLDRYRVGRIIAPKVSYASMEYAAWKDAAMREGAQQIIAAAGLVLDLGDGVRLEILAPFGDVSGVDHDSIHDAMVVMKLVWNGASALLTGDAERTLEYKIVESGADLDVDLLKVGHHGSRTSTSELLLREASPEIAVISVGMGNRYGHPHPAVVENIEAHGIRMFRTDREGTLRFVSHGDRFIRE